RAKLAALRTSKAFARLKIQLQKQPARFAFKSAFAHFPSRLELQGRRKQCFRCHRPEAVPPSRDLQGPAMRPLLVARALRAPLSQNTIICAYPCPIAGSPNSFGTKPKMTKTSLSARQPLARLAFWLAVILGRPFG